MAANSHKDQWCLIPGMFRVAIQLAGTWVGVKEWTWEMGAGNVMYPVSTAELTTLDMFIG